VLSVTSMEQDGTTIVGVNANSSLEISFFFSLSLGFIGRGGGGGSGADPGPVRDNEGTTTNAGGGGGFGCCFGGGWGATGGDCCGPGVELEISFLISLSALSFFDPFREARRSLNVALNLSRSFVRVLPFFDSMEFALAFAALRAALAAFSAAAVFAAQKV
jgi:hypothetical protein